MPWICAALLGGLGMGPLEDSGARQDVLQSFAGLPAMERSAREHGESSLEMFPWLTPSIQALTVTRDQSVYAGSFGMGIFRSNTRGESWSQINAGLGDLFILSLVEAQNGAIYAGTLRGGVFRSKDGGKSWRAVNRGLRLLQVKALLAQGGVIYAGTGDGVYRLAEKVDLWTIVTKGLGETLVHALAMAPDNTLYAGTSGKGLLRYRAKASQWTRLRHGLVDHEGLAENFIRVLTVDRNHSLYAGTFDSGVFLSSDGGLTWKPISRALPNDSIRGIVTNKRGLFVATGRGIFKSVNKGQRWTPINNGLTNLATQVLADSRDGSLYVGTSTGVFRSDDGKSWVRISKGMQLPSEAPNK
ncbi:MAG: hypothetical protein ACE5MM_01890 [Nitrospiraceae bacterium]